MVYDWTENFDKYQHELSGEKGYAIHDNGKNTEDEFRFSIYEDDGQGNGNFICASNELYWARIIAYSLDDAMLTQLFDHLGNIKLRNIK
jgi:hypothetical protein